MAEFYDMSSALLPTSAEVYSTRFLALGRISMTNEILSSLLKPMTLVCNIEEHMFCTIETVSLFNFILKIDCLNTISHSNLDLEQVERVYVEQSQLASVRIWLFGAYMRLKYSKMIAIINLAHVFLI